MTLGLYASRTVTTPRVMPPKPPAKPVKPATMDDLIADAKLCNRRMNGGQQISASRSAQGNINRVKAARERDENMAQAIQDTLRHQPMNRAEIMREFGLSDDVSRRVVGYMISHGMILSTGKGRNTKWSAA